MTIRSRLVARGSALAVMAGVVLLVGRQEGVNPAARRHHLFASAQPVTVPALAAHVGDRVKLSAAPGDVALDPSAPRLPGEPDQPGAIVFLVGRVARAGSGVILGGSPDAPLVVTTRSQTDVEAGATSRWLLWAIAVYGLAGLGAFLAARALTRALRRAR